MEIKPLAFIWPLRTSPTRVKVCICYFGAAFKHALGWDGRDQAVSENLTGNNFNIIIKLDTIREGQDRREVQNKLIVEFQRRY